jgi:hypothetical protein
VMETPLPRRDFLKHAVASAAALALPFRLYADESDQSRLVGWVEALRNEALGRKGIPLRRRAARVGELAVGTPYEPNTLEAYLRAGGSPPRTEPLIVSLTRFDCVTLVESCLAVARVAAADTAPSWERFKREVERMRYRGGNRRGYTSRLHYFSEWITDSESRHLVRNLGQELGGIADTRPLRFMTEHRGSYPALTDENIYSEIGEMERRLDGHPRWMIPTHCIPDVAERIETGDVLAFATAISGLDVSHAAFAYRDLDKVLRVLHAPLSGGVVEITRRTLPEYVAAIRSATGILIARPLPS